MVLGDSRNLQVGQKVYAIGNPFGLSGTMTRGIVSSIRQVREPDGMTIEDAIQTDAAINPGNSGGPLLNWHGEVIGINTMIASSVGQSAGIGFAIPINTAKAVLNDLVTLGRVRRPALGVRYTILKKSGDQPVEVGSGTVFHAGDRIRIAVEANDDGYLYVVNQGSSGTWKLLFPSPEIKDGDNHIQKRVRYEIPSGYTFTFDEQSGEEKLFIVLSRQPEPDLEGLIYSLGNPAKDRPAVEKPKMLLASAAFGNDVIGKLRNAYARDLIVEKVDDEQAGPKQEKAVYAVNPSGSADSRVVADVTLKHQ